jgi:hypothetical protein
MTAAASALSAMRHVAITAALVIARSRCSAKRCGHAVQRAHRIGSLGVIV